MPDLDNALVREKTRYYAARPEYMQRIVDRSRLYLYHIVEEIEKRGMPTELALLPMVESAFNPMAYSRAHASGLWQFIPGTGKRFELEQNWWYDARRDIVESTNAALDYLTKLYEMHGDWQLALASYNWGENAVARAIAKNQAAGLPTDYASLTHAGGNPALHPEAAGAEEHHRQPRALRHRARPDPEPALLRHHHQAARHRRAARRAPGRDAGGRVHRPQPGLQPAGIRAAMTPRIVLPADKVDVFHDNLSALGDKSLVSWKSYHPKQGETFESIAKKHGIMVGQLKEVNGIAPRSKAVPRLLVVPTKAESGIGATSAQRLPIMYAPPIPVATRRVFHTVKKGETLTSIANRYKVSVEDLKRWNGVSTAVAGKTLALEVRSTPSKPKGKPKAQAKGKPYKKTPA